MAVDTNKKRESAFDWMDDMSVLMPVSDNLTRADKQDIWGLFSSIGQDRAVNALNSGLYHYTGDIYPWDAAVRNTTGEKWVFPWRSVTEVTRISERIAGGDPDGVCP